LAYISLIHDNWHAEAFRLGNDFKIIVNVGRDAAVGHTYSIMVGLAPQPGGASEYYFCILDLDETTGELADCHSGLESGNILPKVQRGAILRAILHATKLLLGQVNPVTVNWSTFDLNFPDKALVKYNRVVRVFEGSGYTVTAGEPHNGQHFWSAERLNAPGFPYDEPEGDE
jgi:hypothetical protein